MSVQTTATAEYHKTLLQYFEEEIMGEAYFHGLVPHFTEPGAKAALEALAHVERHAAEAEHPLIEKHDLKPRPQSELARLAEADTVSHTGLSWREFVSYMAKRYPAYLEDFAGLEKMAPPEDLPALQFLTEHEVAAIEFANLELAGNADSLRPLTRYLATEPPR